MNKQFLFPLFLLLGWSLFANTTSIEDKWLVILSASETYEQALEKQSKLAVITKIVHTTGYENLTPGWYINCIPFDNKQEASYFSTLLQNTGTDNYLKFTGQNTHLPEYLLRNHFLVYENQYILSNFLLSSADVELELTEMSIGQYAWKTANVPMHLLPESARQWLDKEWVLYSANGKQIKARISGFEAGTGRLTRLKKRTHTPSYQLP